MTVHVEEPALPATTRTTWRYRIGITSLFVALTALITWPQVTVLGTHAADHHDIFFNLWRFRWIAHALVQSPLDLFNGNIFHPNEGVLAYSDAMLLEGVIAAPLLLVGLPPMLVHNLLLLGAIVASGVGMYVFARHMTGSQPAAVLAGIVFAYAPYRFEHYMHMELQWAVWIPWAFYWLQRTIESPSAKSGALTGLFVALQMLSSIYYGIFLSLLLAVVAGIQLVALPIARAWRCVRVLAIGGLIAASISWVYSRPYTEASREVGTRNLHEVSMFSAQPRDYKVATPTNLLYGERFPGRGERRLFPGVVPLLLALVGLLLIPPTATITAYVIGLALAFELSLGAYGLVYPFLYDNLSAFRGLRAPARVSVLGLFFLGVLAARGVAAMSETARPTVRKAIAAVFCAVVILEYWVAPVRLIRYPNEPPALYKWLANQPRGIVVEFPMLHPSVPGYESRYSYMSTFHWMPLLNGYSGYFPHPYLRRLERLREHFPDDNTMAELRKAGVRYIIIHSGGYTPAERHDIVTRLIHDHGLALAADFDDGWGEGAVFVLP